jgi:hypothetical protein
LLALWAHPATSYSHIWPNRDTAGRNIDGHDGWYAKRNPSADLGLVHTGAVDADRHALTDVDPYTLDSADPPACA